jgi:hypothetical protein
MFEKEPKYQYENLKLKAQNINIKPLLKPWNTHNKLRVETDCFRENWVCKKQAKVAQVAKCCPIWSHCILRTKKFYESGHSQTIF